MIHDVAGFAYFNKNIDKQVNCYNSHSHIWSKYICSVSTAKRVLLF